MNGLRTITQREKVIPLLIHRYTLLLLVHNNYIQKNIECFTPLINVVPSFVMVDDVCVCRHMYGIILYDFFDFIFMTSSIL